MKDKPEDYWKAKLTPEQYHILREKGTERSGTGRFENNHETGMYECGACGNELFTSDTKFDSHCGWPSFDKAIKGHIDRKEDHSFGMHRIEVTCHRCGSHLGHLFDDGPTETSQRFCINSAALTFKNQKSNRVQG